MQCTWIRLDKGLFTKDITPNLEILYPLLIASTPYLQMGDNIFRIKGGTSNFWDYGGGGGGGGICTTNFLWVSSKKLI